MLHRRAFISSIAIITAVALFGCTNTPNYAALPAGAKVVALGDSLTVGVGANPNQSYPVLLANKTGWQIINMGVSGDTTEGVLARIEAVIYEKPALVLLGIGGNDVLRKVPKEQSRTNLTSIIMRLQAANIPVVLIAEPHLSVSALFGKASDNPIYQDVANTTGVPLLTKSWSKILSDNQLKSDQIHANAAGYAIFADELYQYLKSIGYVS